MWTPYAIVPATTPLTIKSGSTPVVINWDYLNTAPVVGRSSSEWKVFLPAGVALGSFYAQAINKNAPHPAAARLWEEYLYSTTGQNLWLEGKARPIELNTLISDKTVNEMAYKALPPAPAATLTFPSIAQQNAAETIVSQQWPSVSG